MKPRFTRLLIALTFLTLPAGAQETPSLLYVQHATSGSLESIKGIAGEMELTLRGVAPSVVYFTDRPYRKTGSTPVTTLVSKWGAGTDSFLKDPPNASLEVSSGQMVILELGRPRYDVASSTIRYRARMLSTSSGFPKRFSHAFLVIDDASADDDNTIYRVVVNDNYQYSIWPADRQVAPSWHDEGFSGTKQQCLDRIRALELNPPPRPPIAPIGQASFYRVVIDANRQYQILASNQFLPNGWIDTGVSGTLQQCQDYVSKITNPKPLAH